MCPWCDSVVRVTSPHVAVVAGQVRTYCSADCLGAAQAGIAREDLTTRFDVPPRRNRKKFVLLGLALGLAGLAIVPRYKAAPPAAPAALPAMATSLVAVEPAPSEPTPTPEQLWVAELAKDAWIHPLRGVRRMPRNHSNVFGAERPGDRPVECLSGHCGVDLGGEVWGEPIVAVHDGVIDRVRRDENPDHGGMYVRIAHRNATVFTQYFHLAAIPKGLAKGQHVKLGTVIGLLGDTGVHHSTAHLHFTISVRPSPDKVERYIDPEPLIALWPLLVPDVPNDMDLSMTASMSTVIPPGLPKRGTGPKKKKKKKVLDEASEATAAVVEERVEPEPASPPPVLPPGPATF